MYSLSFGSFLWSAPVQDETAESVSCLFLWVHTNKSRPFTVPNDVLLLPLSEKNDVVGYFKLFPLKKMQVFALVPPCPAERALASTLHTNLDIGLRTLLL